MFHHSAICAFQMILTNLNPSADNQILTQYMSLCLQMLSL